MFTRSELEIKTVNELADLCRRYGVKSVNSYQLSVIRCIGVGKEAPLTPTSLFVGDLYPNDETDNC
ncbi:hypothetical protein Cal7507_5394 [Calothrix sp. PCC 7507]|nr:hypothetical protein Cal7507_5394 [Calothrix sp. PCC 7507]